MGQVVSSKDKNRNHLICSDIQIDLNDTVNQNVHTYNLYPLQQCDRQEELVQEPPDKFRRVRLQERDADRGLREFRMCSVEEHEDTVQRFVRSTHRGRGPL